MPHVLFFGRAIFLAMKWCDLRAPLGKSYQWFLSPPAHLLGPARRQRDLWAGTSLAAPLEQREIIMQLESYPLSRSPLLKSGRSQATVGFT